MAMSRPTDVGPATFQGGWHQSAYEAGAFHRQAESWWQVPPGYGFVHAGHQGEERRSRSRHGWSPRGVPQHYCPPPQYYPPPGSFGGSAAEGSSKRREPPGDQHAEDSTCSDSRGSSEKSGGECEDDEIVHFEWSQGQILNSRYELEELMGDGTFGRVCLARDKLESRRVAIKIIRDVKRYMENAKVEADILKDIRKADPNGSSRCAIMYETFTHLNKYCCLVFEPLGISLYEFLKKNHFRGFWAQDIQVHAKQLLKALKFMHRELKLTHTDLKPENILLQSMAPPRTCRFPRETAWLETQKSSFRNGIIPPYLRPVSADIKIIDFGNATYEEEHHSSVINTRQYRGPEVVLETGWNEKSDIWSVGCILMELYTADLLFGTHENLEHLALMERIIGPLPGALLERAPHEVKQKYLASSPSSRHGYRLNWPDGASSPASESHVACQLPLAQHVQREHQLLASLVSQLLTHDMSRRPSASEALRHKFFAESFDD
eukprot:TRINITY_DN17300_c0_g1_i2.p1 TRINITY_DN17300_c0_g1~~TRINITY_DN17300_c0_g1_i2.p1  ORF type:complete len:492 (-),score=67.02 TRINITY_DN17300_c0_g1_i2:70-1545(-)